MAPSQDYVTVLSQLGGRTTLTLAPGKSPPPPLDLIDEQMPGDEEWMRQQEVAVGILDLARKYIALSATEEDPTQGEVPEGSKLRTVQNSRVWQLIQPWLTPIKS